MRVTKEQLKKAAPYAIAAGAIGAGMLATGPGGDQQIQMVSALITPTAGSPTATSTVTPEPTDYYMPTPGNMKTEMKTYSTSPYSVTLNALATQIAGEDAFGMALCGHSADIQTLDRIGAAVKVYSPTLGAMLDRWFENTENVTIQGYFAPTYNDVGTFSQLIVVTKAYSDTMYNVPLPRRTEIPRRPTATSVFEIRTPALPTATPTGSVSEIAAEFFRKIASESAPESVPSDTFVFAVYGARNSDVCRIYDVRPVANYYAAITELAQMGYGTYYVIREDSP